MHYLGLAGMPRRIPDYPEAYEELNLLCSLGSLITLGSVIILIYIINDVIYYQNVKKKLGII